MIDVQTRQLPVECTKLALALLEKGFEQVCVWDQDHIPQGAARPHASCFGMAYVRKHLNGRDEAWNLWLPLHERDMAGDGWRRGVQVIVEHWEAGAAHALEELSAHA